jgi:alpha-L-fucosidase 2
VLSADAAGAARAAVLKTRVFRHYVNQFKWHGARARGGFEVDLEWKDGALTQAVVRGVSNGPGPCVVRYGNTTRTLEIAAGEKKIMTADNFRYTQELPGEWTIAEIGSLKEREQSL